MDSSGTALSEESFLVREVVFSYIHQITANGFLFLGVKSYETLSIEDGVEACFLKAQTAMKMNIGFFPARRGLNGGFTVFLVLPVNRCLCLEDYLKLHGHEELTQFFSYRDPATEIRSFAEVFMQMLCDLFDGDLKPILDGTYFEETPINWGGYK